MEAVLGGVAIQTSAPEEQLKRLWDWNRRFNLGFGRSDFRVAENTFTPWVLPFYDEVLVLAVEFNSPAKTFAAVCQVFGSVFNRENGEGLKLTSYADWNTLRPYNDHRSVRGLHWVILNPLAHSGPDTGYGISPQAAAGNGNDLASSSMLWAVAHNPDLARQMGLPDYDSDFNKGRPQSAEEKPRLPFAWLGGWRVSDNYFSGCQRQLAVPRLEYRRWGVDRDCQDGRYRQIVITIGGVNNAGTYFAVPTVRRPS